MTYDLFLGDRTYSSWSLRGWLMFEKFGIATQTHFVDFSAEASVADQLPGLAPAKTVPTLRLPDGAVASESLAIAEELASRHPDAGIWPADPAARATARSLAAEMASGFGPLRTHCPMNLRVAYENVEIPPEVEQDLRRLEHIWSHARAKTDAQGPWLCGDYSVADVFYAPIAARIAGYGLTVSDEAQAYVAAHLADPAFRSWRAEGLACDPVLPWYVRDYDQVPWPGPD